MSSILPASPVTCSVDLAAPGVHHGHLRLPHSRDTSAWGTLLIPLTVVSHGQGPTALLTGGNHGDEYEGPIALFDLARSLGAEDIQGRVIIVPAMNYPAFLDAKRTSPVDGGNLNRLFPGHPRGSLTEKIADYFQRYLLPLADFVLDFHSGGKSLDFVPFAAAHHLGDPPHEAACRQAMLAFAAPYSVTLRELDAVGMYDTAAENLGKVFVSTELGGGGTARAELVAIAKRGVRNFLCHAGILAAQAEPAPTKLLAMPGDDCYVVSHHQGLVEPVVDLGAEVAAGALLARVYDVQRTGAAVAEYRAPRGGILIGRHFPGLVQVGDPLAILGVAEGD
ncbi:MAG: N(2)-acetyl-L-2,4-diaminobutanoate deacetylase DoeB [Candidatus Competibacterales bacterium]